MLSVSLRNYTKSLEPIPPPHQEWFSPQTCDNGSLRFATLDLNNEEALDEISRQLEEYKTDSRQNSRNTQFLTILYMTAALVETIFFTAVALLLLPLRIITDDYHNINISRGKKAYEVFRSGEPELLDRTQFTFPITKTSSIQEELDAVMLFNETVEVINRPDERNYSEVHEDDSIDPIRDVTQYAFTLMAKFAGGLYWTVTGNTLAREGECEELPENGEQKQIYVTRAQNYLEYRVENDRLLPLEQIENVVDYLNHRIHSENCG